MFIIQIFLKSGISQTSLKQDLGTIAFEDISIASDIYRIETVFKQEKIESLEVFLEDLIIREVISEEISFIEDYLFKFYNLVVDYLFKLSYSNITSIALEDFLSARFLPDYHVIEYLAKEAQLDRYSVSKVLVALSNLLRDCQSYDVRQLNAISLRIHKAIMNNNKTVFVITEF
jgi:hypothetical protein